MSRANLAAMRVSLAAIGDYLEQAIALSAEAQDPEATPKPGREQGLVGTYIELARGALERFEDAANGAFEVTHGA